MDGILSVLDNKYRISSDYDTLLRKLYLMRQGSRESVSAFSARLTDQMSAIEEGHPDKLNDDEVDRIMKDRLYGGLRVEIKTALSHLEDRLDEYTYDKFLEIVKRKEASHDDDAHRRTLDSGYHRNDRKDSRDPRQGPRGRMAIPRPASESSEDSASGVESATSDSEGHADVRLARAMDKYEDKRRLCYGCQSPDHLIRDCPEKTMAKKAYLNAKQGSTKGARVPPKTTPKTAPKATDDRPGPAATN